MKISELLNEAKYKKQLSAKKAWTLLNAHCNDALKDLKQPIVRGMTPVNGGLALITGENGKRVSANTTNFYTVIFDHTLGAIGYPLRSKSIICANFKNSSYVAQYGDKYAIVPFDGVKIGVCPGADMWDTNIKLPGDRYRSVDEINDIFYYWGIKEPRSFNGLVAALKMAARKDNTMSDDSEDINKRLGTNIEATLEEAYSEEATGFKLATTATSKLYNDGKKHELWIGGKCVAIEWSIYQEMMQGARSETKV